jgi:hypothetical protein
MSRRSPERQPDRDKVGSYATSAHHAPNHTGDDERDDIEPGQVVDRWEWETERQRGYHPQMGSASRRSGSPRDTDRETESSRDEGMEVTSALEAFSRYIAPMSMCMTGTND